MLVCCLQRPGSSWRLNQDYRNKVKKKTEDSKSGIRNAASCLVLANASKNARLKTNKNNEIQPQNHILLAN